LIEFRVEKSLSESNQLVLKKALLKYITGNELNVKDLLKS